MTSTGVSTAKSVTRLTGTGFSAPSSNGGSPCDTPRHSASSTSLSSVASDAVASKSKKTEANYGNLYDAYGNEFTVPDFTIKDIYDAIPKHCFKRSTLHGYLYVSRDLFCIASIFYVWHNYVTPENITSYPVRWGLWAVYTILQGLFGTGIWVIAHECGHQAFSNSKIVNDMTGWFLHSWLLVPYWSWKISHSKHHKGTANIERDMVFLPRTREEHASKLGKFVEDLHELTEETPIATLLDLLAQQLLGWPYYLLGNITGHNNHERQREGRGKGKKNGLFGGVNHINPNSPLYENRDVPLILLSDLGIILVISTLVYLGNTYGWNNMLVWYWIPYLWVNNWLVAITFQQHTDPSIPHYTGEAWNFVRGAAATIDRDFGFIGVHIFHRIIETHVLHHYISIIPFYQAQEASEAIQKVMGKHYRADTEGGIWGFFVALWRTARWCQWVEPCKDAKGEGNGILFYRNRNNLGPAPLNKEEYLAKKAETIVKTKA